MSTASARSRSKPSAKRPAKTTAAAPPSLFGDLSGWPQWREHLQTRAFVSPLAAKSKKPGDSPLLWSLPDTIDRKDSEKLVELLQVGATNAARRKRIEDFVAGWLASTASDDRFVWESCVLLHALPQLVGLLDEVVWPGAIDRLRTLAREGTALDAEDSPYRAFLTTVEIPLTLAKLFPELESCEALEPYAIRSLGAFAEEWLDGEGMPQGRYLSLMRPLLAAWTRCLLLASDDEGKSPEGVTHQADWLLRQTIRCTRSEGTNAFAEFNRRDDWSAWLPIALDRIDDAESRTLAKTLLIEPRRGVAAAKKPGIEPCVYSEWGKAAVLRIDGDKYSPRAFVAFDEPTMRLEIAAEQTILSGDWTSELAIDGVPQPVTQAWDEVCWHVDDAAVYLEVETQLSPQWRLQRQILLARREHFLLLADVILGDREADISYRSSLPKIAGLGFSSEAETNEARITDRSLGWLLIPPALSEWRSQRSIGELSERDGCVSLTASRRGRRLYSPLVIDLRARRGQPQRTWRQLTVGEQLVIQSPETAAAYRVQIDEAQWVFYRALAGRSNRTFIGKNLSTEFYAGRFLKNGRLGTIMEVE